MQRTLAFKLFDDRKIAHADAAHGVIRKFSKIPLYELKIERGCRHPGRSTINRLLNLIDKPLRNSAPHPSIALLSDMVARLDDRRHREEQCDARVDMFCKLPHHVVTLLVAVGDIQHIAENTGIDQADTHRSVVSASRAPSQARSRARRSSAVCRLFRKRSSVPRVTRSPSEPWAISSG